jgi:hypothetical protein
MKLKLPATSHLRKPDATPLPATLVRAPIEEAIKAEQMATVASDVDIRGMTSSLLKNGLETAGEDPYQERDLRLSKGVLGRGSR